MALTALDLLVLLQCVQRIWTKMPSLNNRFVTCNRFERTVYEVGEATKHSCAGYGKINRSARPKTADHAVRSIC